MAEPGAVLRRGGADDAPHPGGSRARAEDGKALGSMGASCRSPMSPPAHQPAGVDLLDLHTALDELAGFDHRKSQVAELRFFGGLSLEETGHVLDISIATVEREWQAARAWLFSHLKGRHRDA